MGQRGTSFYEVNASGREVGAAAELDDTRPIPGNNIRTTIDLQLQLFCDVPQVPCRKPPGRVTIWYEVGRHLPCLLMGEGVQTC